MKLLFISLLILFSSLISQSAPTTLSFFHTFDSFFDELTQLKSSCSKLEIIPDSTNNDLKTVLFNINGGSSNKIMLIGNEHGNELITSEVILAFIKDLCSEATPEISSYSYIFIPIVNVYGRKAVEGGNACQRGNENNVDINRNYDYQWKPSDREGISFGDAAFSEAESKYVVSIGDQYKPTIYGSLHSGAIMCFTPYAYKIGSPSPNVMLEPIKKACEGKATVIGPLAEGIGYLAPGNSMDYMFDVKHVPKTFALEVYDGDYPTGPPSESSFLQLNSRDKLFRKAKVKRHTCFDELLPSHRFKSSHTMTTGTPFTFDDINDFCVKNFMPTSSSVYDSTLVTWKGVITNLIKEAADTQSAPPPQQESAPPLPVLPPS